MTGRSEEGADELLRRLADGAETDDEIVAWLGEILRSSSPSSVTRASKRLLRVDLFRRDPDVLLLVAQTAGPRLIGFLHRRVFSRLHGVAPIYDAIYAAIRLGDREARRRQLARVAMAWEARDDAKLLEIERELFRFELPPGYVWEKRHQGSGKTSWVALLRRVSDGARVVWKIPADDSMATRDALREQVERSREWCRIGVSSAEATYAPDGESLLQPFVEGVTLHRLLKSDALEESHRLALSRWLGRMVASACYISGLNPRNLVFDGAEWQIIDSGSIRRCAGVAATWRRQRRELLSQWTRWTPQRRQQLEQLLDDIGQAHGLRPPSTISRWVDRWKERR